MSRRDIYYWKCDRPAAFHGTALNGSDADLAARLADALGAHFGAARWQSVTFTGFGTRDAIHAFIDFDDAISGDAMDDLSLLACFHDAAFLRAALDGYASVRSLPVEHEKRFWLHLPRNMIVKSVIRVGAGYFDRDDGFFLITAGGSGGSLKETTRARLALAVAALEHGWPISRLG